MLLSVNILVRACLSHRRWEDNGGAEVVLL